MSDVRVDASPTPADISAAVWGDVLGSWRAFAAPASGLVFALVMMAIAPWDGTLESAVMFAQGGLFFGFWMTLFFAVLFFLGARRLARMPGMLDKVSYVLGPAGIQASSDRKSTSVDWSCWQRAYETRSVLVVCGQLNAFHVLPKRQISKDALASLRSLLRAELKGRVRFKRKA